MIVGVAYHYVRPSYDQPHPGIFGLTVDEFRTQLELLGRYGQFIGLADLEAAFDGRKSLPNRGWMITFDDGLREQYEHALPVLDELRIPALFFANTKPGAEHEPLAVHMAHLLRSQIAPGTIMATVLDIANSRTLRIGEIDRQKAANQYPYDTPEAAELKYLLNFELPESLREQVMETCFDRLLGWDRPAVCRSLYMSTDQLTELARRGYLGTHTHSHPPLGLLEMSAARNDIRRSIELLEKWTGVRVNSIGYPYGSFEACPRHVGKLSAELGIRFGFTMERAGFGVDDDAMLLPRYAPNDVPGGNSSRWKGQEIFTLTPRSSRYSDNGSKSTSSAIHA